MLNNIVRKRLEFVLNREVASKPVILLYFEIQNNMKAPETNSGLYTIYGLQEIDNELGKNEVRVPSPPQIYAAPDRGLFLFFHVVNLFA